MGKYELIKALKDLADLGDPEAAHSMADDLLLEYINDDEVRVAFNAIKKWYA